jgi:hypothetical protein
MTTTPYFLTINLDADNLITSQSGLNNAEVLSNIDAAPAGLGYVVCGTGLDVPIGDIPLGELAAGDLVLTNNDIIVRNLSIGTSLSSHVNASVQVDSSSITVSSCPVPPPWSFTEVTSDDGENTADAYYFASGSSQATTELAAHNITWNSTESYFTIANVGWYEFEMQGSVIVASSPTTITTSIVQTTGLGGSEIEKIDKAQIIRTNIDPHDIMIKWVGYCAAANFTCKIDGTAAVVMQKGSTFTCKRLI